MEIVFVAIAPPWKMEMVNGRDCTSSLELYISASMEKSPHISANPVSKD